MKWRIIFARTAEKELARLSSEMRLRLGRAIRSLENDPIPAQTKRLKGRTEFRMRVETTECYTPSSTKTAL